MHLFFSVGCGQASRLAPQLKCTLFATPSEFLRDLLREKKERMEAAEMRDAILEGCCDLIEGRVVEFNGDLRASLRQAQRRETQAWK